MTMHEYEDGSWEHLPSFHPPYHHLHIYHKECNIPLPLSLALSPREMTWMQLTTQPGGEERRTDVERNVGPLVVEEGAVVKWVEVIQRFP
jgi:hypothetical protein